MIMIKLRDFSRIFPPAIVLELVFVGLTFPALAVAGSSPVLTRANGVFSLDGVAISRFGIRAANALESDQVTQNFVANLDNMKSHGIQSVNVSLQGGNTGTANGFNSDGTLNMTYFNRLESILNAAASRNMAVVVTYFHSSRQTTFADNNAILQAVRLATDFLRPWRNVWLYVMNEPCDPSWTLGIFASNQSQIYNVAKDEDSARLVYVSDAANDGFAAHTARTASSGNVVVEYSRQDSYTAPGVFTSAQMSQAQADATTTFNNRAYWFWHAAWHQKADATGWPRYDMGGAGRAADPGVAFVWNAIGTLAGPRTTSCRTTSGGGSNPAVAAGFRSTSPVAKVIGFPFPEPF